MRVVVTGGGTGGHVYPGLSLARYLTQSHPEAEIMFIGSSSGPEAKVTGSAGVPFRGLELTGLTGRRITARVRAILLFLRGTLRALKMLRGFRPVCVVGTGGYAAAPACFAAVVLRMPLILHEMNYYPGLVTRLMSRWAYAVSLAHEETSKMLPKRARSVVTGVPVRPEIEALGDRGRSEETVKEALALFDLEPERKTLLVFGGSQGAEALNKAVWEVLPRVTGRGDIQVLHLTGEDAFDSPRRKEAEGLLIEAPLAYRVIQYTDRMDLAYGVSDLAVCRAGAGTVAELASAGIPAVLVPFPYATAGHQDSNAQKLAAAGAARVVRQEGPSAVAALEEALRLLDSQDELRRMAAAAGELHGTGGARGIAAIIEELSEKR